MSLWQPNSWQKTASEKKARILESIPKEWRIEAAGPEGSDSVMGYEKSCGFMSADELAITESSAVELVKKMAACELTSVAVTTAFCKRAALAQQLVRTTPECYTSVTYRELIGNVDELYTRVLPGNGALTSPGT